MKRLFALWIALFVATSGCTDGPAPTTAPPLSGRVTVTLELFSGRPAPSWTISDARNLAALRERLQGLPPIARPPDFFDHRHLRFEVTNVSVGASLPDSLRIDPPVIEVRRGTARTYHRDTLGLARWLDEDAGARGVWSDALDFR